MKKSIIISFFAIMLIFLAACNASTGSSSSSDNTDLNSDPNADLSTEMKLLIGTIKLEDTDQAVSAEQAADLVPLWQAYLSLVTSQTAATEELSAVINQIQDTMTTEQVQAIEAMNLTREDQFTVMQSLGFGGNFNGNPTNPEGTPMAPGMFPGGGGDGQGFDPGQGGTRPDFNPPEGGFPQGGMGPGGGQGGDFPGGNIDRSQIATLQAQGTPAFRGGANRIMTPLIQALIDLLQKKITP